MMSLSQDKLHYLEKTTIISLSRDNIIISLSRDTKTSLSGENDNYLLIAK